MNNYTIPGIRVVFSSRVFETFQFARCPLLLTSNEQPRRMNRRDELTAAFETYRQEVEGLRMFLLTLGEHPTDGKLELMAWRKLSVDAALAAYTMVKTRYARELFGNASTKPAE